MQAGIKIAICTVFGKGSSTYPARPYFFLWANIASAWLPIQTYGDTSTYILNNARWCKVVNLHYVNIAPPFINTWAANIANAWIWLPSTSIWKCSSAHHVTCGRQILQTHGFPVQTYGKHFRSTTLILRCEQKSDRMFETSDSILRAGQKSKPESFSKYLIFHLKSFLFFLLGV